MDMRLTAPLSTQPVARRDDAPATRLGRPDTRVEQAPATQPAATAQMPALQGHGKVPRTPGATVNFTAQQAQVNTDVTAAQRALAFVGAATEQLRGLKGVLSATLGGAARSSDDAAARIASFDALWRDRAALSGGMLDSQLAVHPGADATRTFRLRALDVETWRNGGAETLTFHPAGPGKQTASITFDSKPLAPAEFARRLDRALASTGVRVSLAADGQVDLTVAESRWPTVRDHLMLQGGGKRFPGGRPSLAQTDAAPEAIEPARWQVKDRATQRATLRDVVRALDGLARADKTLRTRLDTAAHRLASGAGEAAGTRAGRAADAVTNALEVPSDFNVLSVVTTALSGLSRTRVETLLKL